MENPFPTPPTGDVVVAFGELAQDVIVTPQHVLAFGGGHVDGDITFFRGGCGPNVAAGCAELRTPSRFLGHNGVDVTANDFDGRLVAAGVDVRGPRRGVMARSVSIATPDGDTALVFNPGDSRSMKPADFSSSDLDRAAVLHLNSHHLYSPETAAVTWRLIELAQQAEIPISLDVSAANRLRAYGAERYREDLRKIRPMFLMANRAEATALGLQERSPLGVEITFIHRGPKSTICLLPNSTTTVPVEPVENVVDTTGAGDAFAAGVLCGWMEGMSVEAAVMSAHALAAELIVRPGTEYSVEKRAVVRRLA